MLPCAWLPYANAIHWYVILKVEEQLVMTKIGCTIVIVMGKDISLVEEGQ